MMNQRLFGFALLLLQGSLHLRAQQQQELCVCHGDSCDVFEVRHVGGIRFADGFVAIGHQSPYGVQRIDSLVFLRPPQLAATELGWWGTLSEGPSRYEARIDDRNLGFAYRASYRFVAASGICREACCEITFGSAEQKEQFWVAYLSAPATDANDDPYIYVKETLTGPRKFELWVMSGEVLPAAAAHDGQAVSDEGDTQLWVNLGTQLAGRPMTDVQNVIEGWLYTPLMQTENPTYETPTE